MNSLSLVESPNDIRGVFRIVVKDRNGDVVHTYEDRNMIVLGAKRAICLRLSDKNTDSKIISKIGFGKNIATPTPTDSALTDAYVKQVDSYSYPDTNKVTFKWSLGYDEANGISIVEFGLLCTDDTLFARKVRGALTKESDLMLEGEWTLIF